MLAVVLAAYPLAFAPEEAPLLGTIGGAGVLLTVLAATGAWLSAVGWALGLLSVEYLISLYLAGQGLGLATPIYAALMLAVAELVYLARHLAIGIGPGEPALRRRLAVTAGSVLAAVVLGSVLLILALVPISGGVWLTAVGTVAALGALSVLTWAARRG